MGRRLEGSRNVEGGKKQSAKLVRYLARFQQCRNSANHLYLLPPASKQIRDRKDTFEEKEELTSSIFSRKTLH